MKNKCDVCQKKIRENTYGSRATRPWFHCEKCNTTTILDPEKEYAEYKCSECGNNWTSKYPETCDACGAHAVNQVFVRYVSVSEIEAA